MSVPSRFRNTHVASGVALVAVCAIVLFSTRKLERIGLMDIGPGYFPVLVAVLLGAIGAILCVIGMLRPAPALAFAEGLAPAIVVTTGVVLFALLLPRLGLVPAIFALVLVGSRASSGFALRKALLLALALSVATALVFRAGLSLPFMLLPAWI